MKRLRLLLVGFAVLCAATGYSVTVYQNDYEGQTVGAGFPAWNWGDNGTVHTAVYADYSGNIVVEHTGTLDNTAGTEAVNSRFGSKWDITMSGNTSSNPADYIISFDLKNESGDWDPVNLEFFVLTQSADTEDGTDPAGFGSGASAYAQADGWIHVEKSLADLPVTWWQGTDWVLTDAVWSIEVGGPPWPGVSVAAGESITETWLMDNLKVEMIPEPASLVLLGLGSLAIARKRK